MKDSKEHLGTESIGRLLVKYSIPAIITGTVLIREFRSYKNKDVEADEESKTKQSQLEF